jgi:DNA-directed RNA polymerase subunit beta'
VAGLDITSGLPRVEELFEVRIPKGAAMLADIDGVATLDEPMEGRRLRITSREQYREDYEIPTNADVLVVEGEWVEEGMALARTVSPESAEGGDQDSEPNLAEWTPAELRAGMSGRIEVGNGSLAVVYEDLEERDYPLPPSVRVLVTTGSEVRAGDALTAGPLNPHDILRIRGSEELQRYLVEEVQKVYRSQGVSIHDKHIEVILRQMLRRVQVESPGDSEFIPGQTVDRFEFRSKNAMMLAEGGEPSTAKPVLLGITRASLLTDSFLAAASFQETTRVLTEAVVSGARDRLLGLKENVIIGRLIPARVEAFKEKPLALDADVQDAILPPDWLAEELGYGSRRAGADGGEGFDPATTEDLTDQFFALADSDNAENDAPSAGVKEDVAPV